MSRRTLASRVPHPGFFCRGGCLSRVPHPTFFWLGGPWFRLTLTAILAVTLSLASFAQTTRKTSPPTQTKHFCQPEGGFCFSYPASWSVLGEAFGNDVVIAPPQTGERSLWNVVTVVAIHEPVNPSQGTVSIDQIIETALDNMRAAGHIPATLERQERIVAGLPGQMLRLRYHDDATGRDWVEQLVFAEGPEQEVYSASLKAQPADFEDLQPAFENILRSWKLQTSDDSSARSSQPASSPAKDSQPSPSHP